MRKLLIGIAMLGGVVWVAMHLWNNVDEWWCAICIVLCITFVGGSALVLIAQGLDVWDTMGDVLYPSCKDEEFPDE